MPKHRWATVGLMAMTLILAACGRQDQQTSLPDFVEKSLALVPAGEPWAVQAVDLAGVQDPAGASTLAETMTYVLTADGLVVEPSSVRKVGDVLFSDFNDRVGSRDAFRGAVVRLKIVESDTPRQDLEARLRGLGFETLDTGGVTLWACEQRCQTKELAGLTFFDDRTFAAALGFGTLEEVRGVLSQEKLSHEVARQGLRDLWPRVPPGTSMLQASSCSYDGCTASVSFYTRTSETVASTRLFRFASRSEAESAVDLVKGDLRPDVAVDAGCPEPIGFSVSVEGMRVKSRTVWRVWEDAVTPQPASNPAWGTRLTRC